MPYIPRRPEKGNSGPEHPEKQPVTARQIAVCVCILLAAYGLIRMIAYGVELLSVRKTTQELREIAAVTQTIRPAAEATAVPVSAKTPETMAEAQETPVPTEMPESTAAPVQTEKPEEKAEAPTEELPVIHYPNGYQLVERIKALQKKSKYIIGWITMDNLDEPVVKKDNEFFLDHDAMGKKNSNGALFMDEDTDLLTRPYTIFIYGHNMKTGAMFGDLRKYEEFSYYYKHRIFRFDTMYEEGQYVIISVAKVNLIPGRSQYVNLSALASTDRETRRKAIDDLIRCGTHGSQVDVSEEDQLLLLVTCTGDDDERLIVAARRLREGEQADQLQMKAMGT